MARFQLSSSRVHLDAFAERAAAGVASGQVVLDAGAGDSPYAHWFEQAGATYESVDHHQNDDDARRRVTDRGMPRSYVLVARRP